MHTDNQLLAAYAEEGSELAFQDLVRRHLNMVYGAALRECHGDNAGAEDISQAVFTELAKRARDLRSHPALAGWLYTCVRRMAAANLRRSEHRRQRREEQALLMNEALAPTPTDQLWQEVRPWLDDAMNRRRRKKIGRRLFCAIRRPIAPGGGRATWRERERRPHARRSRFGAAPTPAREARN